MMQLFSPIKHQDINEGVLECANTPGARLIDGRTEDDYASGHIPRSKNITVSQLEHIYSLVPDRSTPLFIYCATTADSGNTAKRLRIMGYTDITDLGRFGAYRGELASGPIDE